MVLNDKTYDTIKWIVIKLLPCTGALYFGLSKLWGLPLAEEVVGTISVIGTFLAGILGISEKNYSGDGTVTTDGNNELHTDIAIPASELAKKKRILLTVNNKKAA